MKNDTMRLLLAIVIVVGGVLMITFLLMNRPGESLRPTMSPVFQVVGKSTEIGDNLIAKVIPVSDFDEKELGEVLSRRYPVRDSLATDRYLNDLIRYLSR